jgi:hypothetical protein
MKKFISKLVTPIVERVLNDLQWDTELFEDIGSRLAEGFIKRLRIELDYELTGNLDADKTMVALSAVIQKNLPKTKPATKAKIKKGF